MIRASGLTVRFGDNTVLDGISLEISKRETVAIMGASGGGKTTLLRCLSGLLSPNTGKVEVLGVDINDCSSHDNQELRLKIGILFQGAALFDYLNVRSNVSFGISRHRKLSQRQQDDLVSHCLKRVGLEGIENLMPSELSGGMRKRVGLARALATDPEILFYDEPTSGLDPITAYSIDSLIVELGQSTAAASVVVSHDIHSVRRTCTRVLYLSEGTIIFDGLPDAFFHSDDPRIRELIEKSQADTVVVS